MDGWRVLKFGGTSVGSAAALRNVVAVTRQAAAEARLVVVTSALSGVTDELALASGGAASGGFAATAFVERQRARHEALLSAVASGRPAARARLELAERLAELERRLQELARARACNAEARDGLLALGERLALPVVVAALQAGGLASVGLDAAELLRTDERFGAAEVEPEATRGLARARLAELPAQPVTVVTGFVGATADGRTTTLGRGGSDLSAAVLGRALDAERVEIWTDVDGVQSADPRLVPTAFTLPRLSYDEAARLAGLGAKVLHPRTLQPLAHGIPLLVRNTLRPSGAVTRVEALPAAATGPLAVAVSVEGDLARVALLPGDEPAGRLAAVATTLLRRAGVTPLAGPEPERGALVALVPARQRAAAAAALHDGLVERPRPVRVVVAGPRGQVARRLLEQVARAATPGLEWRVVGGFDRRRAAWSEEGFDPLALGPAVAEAAAVPWPESVARLLARGERPLVLVDATASAELAAEHPALLEAGIAVVTPNKHGGCLPLPEHRRRLAAERQGGAYRAATTVGAGLPVLRAVSDLRRSGDALLGLEAVLSGTLSFVLGRLQEGRPFSEAVAEAHRLGLCEPDPRQDLCGLDVARKLLVTLRAAGLPLELRDVRVESLLPPELPEALAPEELFELLRGEDAGWERRAGQARAAGRRLAYVARFARGEARAGVEALPSDSALARTRPGENVVQIRSRRHAELPLTLAGPGAGADLTAANLLTDLVDAGHELVWGPAAGPGRHRGAAGVEATPWALPHGACY